MENKEINWMDYARILGKKKWMIISGTLACMIITGILSFAISPVYEIDAIIQPGKFFVVDAAGKFDEVVIEGPQQIANKIRHQSYLAFVASELKMDREDIPEVKAEHIPETLLARMWTRNPDRELSKRVLDSLIGYIKKSIDEKIQIEIDNIDWSITENEIEKNRKFQEIDIQKKKLQIVAQRQREIAEEMKRVKNKIEQLEQEQLQVLKKENKSETETLGLLLYSVEIQQGLRTYDDLDDKLSGQKIRETDITSILQEQEALIQKIDNTIAILKERKGRIDLTRIVKRPTSTISPVWPKKKLNILIAAITGFMVFTAIMLFYELYQSQEIRRKARE